MIVEDDLDRRVGRIGGIELLEEGDELARAMAVFDACVNLSREQVDARQQAQCPMALVFVVACDAACLPATGGRSGAVLAIAWMPGFSS